MTVKDVNDVACCCNWINRFDFLKSTPSKSHTAVAFLGILITVCRTVAAHSIANRNISQASEASVEYCKYDIDKFLLFITSPKCHPTRIDTALDNSTLSDEMRLRNLLQVRHQTLISTDLRPVRNSSHRIPVWLGFSIYNIINTDDKNQILTTKVQKQMVNYADLQQVCSANISGTTIVGLCKGLVDLSPCNVTSNLPCDCMQTELRSPSVTASSAQQSTWINEFATWNPEDYGGITLTVLPHYNFWIPDIVLTNNIVHEPKNTGNVNVYSDGQTDYFQLLTYQSTCTLNMQRFPFDEQNCTFVFSSWSYSNDSLTLDFYHDEGFTNNVDWTASTPSAEWDVVSSGAYRNQVIEGGYFCYHNLTYYIIIRRRPGFYLYVLIIPSLLLSILTPGLFWIPPSRPDRTTLGMSLFSSFFVLMLVLVQTVPASASSSQLGKFYSVSMVVTAMSTMLSAVIVYVSQRYEDRPSTNANIRPMPGTPYTKHVPSAPYSAGISVDLQSNASRRDGGGATSAAADSQTRQIDWRQVISALDRIMFVVSITAIVVTISVLFPR